MVQTRSQPPANNETESNNASVPADAENQTDEGTSAPNADAGPSSTVGNVLVETMEPSQDNTGTTGSVAIPTAEQSAVTDSMASSGAPVATNESKTMEQSSTDTRPATGCREDRSRMTYSEGSLHPLELYELGDTKTNLTFAEMKDLFIRYRESKGKSMDKSHHALRASWNEFIKRYQHERDFESVIRHRRHYNERYSLRSLRERVHAVCVKERRPCFTAAIGDCRVCASVNMTDTIEDWEDSLRRYPISSQLSDLVLRLRRALTDSGHGRPVHRTRSREPRSPQRRPERRPSTAPEAPTYRSWPSSQASGPDTSAYYQRWDPDYVERQHDWRERRDDYRGGSYDPRRSTGYPGEYRSGQRYDQRPSAYGPQRQPEREDLPARSAPYDAYRERDYSPATSSPDRRNRRYRPYGDYRERRSHHSGSRESPPRDLPASTRDYAAAAPNHPPNPPPAPVRQPTPASAPPPNPVPPLAPVSAPAPSTPLPVRSSVVNAPAMDQPRRGEGRRSPDQPVAPPTASDTPVVTGPVPRFFRETDERSLQNADDVATLLYDVEVLQEGRTQDRQDRQQIRNMILTTNQNLRDLRAQLQRQGFDVGGDGPTNPPSRK